MKKLFITLINVLPIFLFSLPLNESFTSIIFPPIGWVIVNRDGGIETWRRDTTIKRTPPASALSSFESNVRVDDWLITPRLIIQPNDSLKFWVRRYLFSYFDTIRTKLSRTTNHPDSFNVLLTEFKVTDDAFAIKRIPLNGFNSETVYIAIIHNAPPNQGKIYIDDITGPEMVEIKDVGVDTISTPNSFVMRPFGTGFQPQAKIRNYSNAIQRNIPVICSIVGQGSILHYENIKYLDSLLIDSSKIITFDSFASMIAEVCTVKIRTLLADDINSSNDRKTRTTQMIQGQYTGGPDANYSYWIDSDTLGGPVYNWIDISLTGTPLPAGGSNFSWPTPIDFAFNFYGEPKTHFCYSTKGFISFDTLLYSYGINRQIPYTDLPNNIVAPFWDDLYTNNGRHQSFGIPPNRYKIIQWNSVFNTAFQDTVIFQIILYENGDIVFQYNRCDNRYNLGQGQSATVGIEDGTGTSGLQYLYNGTPQGNLLSAGRAIRFFRSCHDVTPDSILTSQVGLEDTVIPKVLVENVGTTTESFSTIFNISDNAKSLIYGDTVEVTNLPSATSCTLDFREWIPNQYGIYTAKTWTTLENDINRTNDTCEQDLEVSIAAPILLAPINGFVTNAMTVSFDWTDIIGTTQYNFQIINHLDTIVANSQCGPVNLVEGIYYWRVRAGNETRWGFWSETDTFMIDTTSPAVPILISPTPNCTLYQPYPHFIWQRIDDAVNYNLVVVTNTGIILNQILNDTSYESFQYFANGTYYWKVRCQDQASNWSVFSSIQTYFVSCIVWEQKRDILETNSLRAVKDGGCLVGISNKLYALKGNNTQDFYDYDIGTNQWNNRCLIPFFTTETTIIRKRVKAGASIVYADNLIYALKGNNTREFWAYDPIIDNWICKKPVPSLKGIKDGSGLAYHNGHIYCLLGKSKSFEFLCYNVNQDTWATLDSAPEGRNHQHFNSGSCIVYGGNSKIYALKGGARYNEFYCYDINTNSWQAKDSLPYFHPQIREKNKVRYGGAMVYDGQNTIYAIKGGGKNEFWQWNITSNQWTAKETILRLNKKSVPKSGASLAFADNKVWLIKGNRTLELWSYTIYQTKIANLKTQNIDIKSENDIKCREILPLRFAQGQNDRNRCLGKVIFLRKNQKCSVVNCLKNMPDNVLVKVFDIQGRLVRGIRPKSLLSLNELNNGVYIIVVENKYN